MNKDGNVLREVESIYSHQTFETFLEGRDYDRSVQSFDLHTFDFTQVFFTISNSVRSGSITSYYRQIWHPKKPMSLIVSSIVGRVNENNSIVNTSV